MATGRAERDITPGIKKALKTHMHNNTADMTTLKAVVGDVTPTTDVSSPELIATLIGVEMSHLG